jgi:hypothetical protein
MVSMMAQHSEGVNKTGEMLVVLLSQTAILAGSLFYFGYIRTQSTFGYFGVDVSLLGFSSVDYVVRSGPPIFLPVVCFAVVYLYFFCCVELIRAIAKIGPSGGYRQLASVSISISVMMLTLLLAAVLLESVIDIEGLLLIYASAALAMAGAKLIRLAGGHAGWTLASLLTVPILIVSIALFFLANSLQAYKVGIDISRKLERELGAQPEIELLSERRLGIVDGGGVMTVTIQGSDEKYKYRTTGLKLLIASDGRYFLLRSKPDRSPGEVFVISVADSVRVNVRSTGAGIK